MWSFFYCRAGHFVDFWNQFSLPSSTPLAIPAFSVSFFLFLISHLLLVKLFHSNSLSFSAMPYYYTHISMRIKDIIKKRRKKKTNITLPFLRFDSMKIRIVLVQLNYPTALEFPHPFFMQYTIYVNVIMHRSVLLLLLLQIFFLYCFVIIFLFIFFL